MLLARTVSNAIARRRHARGAAGARPVARALLAGTTSVDAVLEATAPEALPHLDDYLLRHVLASGRLPRAVRTYFARSGALPRQADALRSARPEERAGGARALGAMGEPVMGEWIVALLADPDTAVRCAATDALVALGLAPAVRVAVPRFD